MLFLQWPNINHKGGSGILGISETFLTCSSMKDVNTFVQCYHWREISDTPGSHSGCLLSTEYVVLPSYGLWWSQEQQLLACPPIVLPQSWLNNVTHLTVWCSWVSQGASPYPWHLSPCDQQGPHLRCLSLWMQILQFFDRTDSGDRMHCQRVLLVPVDT